jgi:hypothetical protein
MSYIFEDLVEMPAARSPGELGFALNEARRRVRTANLIVRAARLLYVAGAEKPALNSDIVAVALSCFAALAEAFFVHGRECLSDEECATLAERLARAIGTLSRFRIRRDGETTALVLDHRSYDNLLRLDAVRLMRALAECGYDDLCIEPDK